MAMVSSVLALFHSLQSNCRIACTEHLIPYWMNTKWRSLNAPGFGADVLDFNRRMREIKEKRLIRAHFREAFYCRQLMKRFENLDLDHLQEMFPNVNVKHIRENLNEYVLQDRQSRFNSMFYQKRSNSLE